MKKDNIARALAGGFFATLLMTLIMYWAPMFGAPKMDIAALLGSLFGRGVPAAMTGLWWLGMTWHFINGTVIFSLIYSYFVYGWLPGDNWLRGTVWGLVLWLVMEVTLVPITGGGPFDDHASHAVRLLLAGFILHAIYGALFGAIAGEQPEHTHHIAHPA
jgi:hypothetical protein